MADVFISYASEDRSRVRELAEALKQLSLDVWWDREILIGSMFDEVIEKQLREARCVIVAWTKESVRSRWVRAEAGAAADRGVLIPVLLDETEVPLAFRHIQTAALVDWDGSTEHPGFQSIARAVRALSHGPGPAPTTESPREVPYSAPPASRPARSSARVLAASAALLLCVAAGIYWFLNRGGDPNAAVRPQEPQKVTPGVRENDGPVRVVRVHMVEGGSLSSHGFVTPTGHIVAFAPTTTAETYSISWIEGGQRKRGKARVVTRRNDRGSVPYLALLEAVGDAPGGPRPVTRNAGSLKIGERVERYLSPADRTPGTVVAFKQDFSMEADSHFPALVTTDISGAGDAGAPVLDSDGRIVAVVVGGRAAGGESYSIPVESIKIAFQDAF